MDKLYHLLGFWPSLETVKEICSPGSEQAIIEAGKDFLQTGMALSDIWSGNLNIYPFFLSSETTSCPWAQEVLTTPHKWQARRCLFQFHYPSALLSTSLSTFSAEQAGAEVVVVLFSQSFPAGLKVYKEKHKGIRKTGKRGCYYLEATAEDIDSQKFPNKLPRISTMMPTRLFQFQFFPCWPNP